MDPLAEFLAPDLKAGGRRLPCATLGAALECGRCPDFAGVHGHKVLLLTAFTRNVLAALAGEVDGSAEPITGQGELHLQRNVGREARCGRDLPLPRIRAGEQPILLAQAYALLAQLPLALARPLLAWAPPVLVTAGTGTSLYGNFATALLARVVCPDVPVEIRTLEGLPLFPPNATVGQLQTLLRAELPVLMNFCAGHKQAIAALAGGVLGGQWENGLRRAMTYRYRQRARRAQEAAHAREPEVRGACRETAEGRDRR